ncbi:prepilin-type N-terminal cleavage/methylation domain-containing protein [Candidatus Poribacteria bacterium]|nr:prepilin-type N-terminal cleavage/methylation domain-containing protein [Candidatus Poribacteria bacterium]
METIRNNRGLSLIEVAVSMVILVLLMTGIAAMLTVSIRADTGSQERHIADKLAQQVLERTIDFGKQGGTPPNDVFSQLIDNTRPGAIPAQPAIPGVRPAIPAIPPSDHISDDFDGDGVTDRGMAGSKTIYVYQLLINNVAVGGVGGGDNDDTTTLLKEITVRVYYADQNSAQPQVDQQRHRNPGGQRPRRYDSPLAEITTYLARP